jgi:copper chaperone CopZ
MQNASFAIEEMSCSMCVRHVTEALQHVDGVAVDEVKVGSARVRFDPQKTSPQAMAAVLADAGYPAQPSAAPPSP